MSEADKEEWRDIKGYEGIYQISNLGKVKSLSRTITRKNGSKQKIEERILKPCKSKKGYYLVCLDGKMHTIHRLVAENFVNSLVVNHKNGIKTDNRLSNLELISQKDNIHKAWEQGLCENIRRLAYTKIHRRDIKTSKKVCQMDMDNNVINTFVSIREAEEKTGISDSNIMRCCRNIQESTHGYKFQYIN